NPFSDFVGELTWNWVPTGGSFFSYCVDATRYLNGTQTVEPKSTSQLTGASQSSGSVVARGGADAGRPIAGLVSTNSAEAHPDAAGIFAAALQMGIWETLYDATPDIGNGSFRLVNKPAYANSTSIANKASADLASLYSNVGGSTPYFTSDALYL